MSIQNHPEGVGMGTVFRKHSAFRTPEGNHARCLTATPVRVLHFRDSTGRDLKCVLEVVDLTIFHGTVHLIVHIVVCVCGMYESKIMYMCPHMYVCAYTSECPSACESTHAHVPV